MSEFFSVLPSLAPALVISYLLGSLPLAAWISRRNDVDIFAVGTGLAGASNVRRNVGNIPALIVLLGDIAKGSLAMIVARYIGVHGLWLILPALAAISGHWKSIFTGFRGGDGLAILGGIVLALFLAYGLIAVAVALLVALGGQKMPYTSLLSIVFGYATLVALSINHFGEVALTFGVGGICALVLANASLGHLRRRDEGNWDELEDTEGTAERPRFGS